MMPRILILVFAGFVSLILGCAKGIAQQSEDAMHQGPAMNFHRVSPELATGGHLMESGAADLAEQGVTLVIDLRDKPPEEAEQEFAAAGIRWLNVPVVWKEPKPEDFEAFSQLMAANSDENILVQCQANYRASAFTYMYRVTQQGVPESEAREDLNAIWTPEGTWRDYIDEIMVAED